ncbi:precursor of CEP16-like [Abrus precatorius]|uniref:Precursor of CEP16-like n=1 Tax=Abrus precatorius TaxID=3816 RepID=A0A8B8MGP8_ABRPR|nr:precursor of CEP16-like [Abrus precatorius]
MDTRLKSSVTLLTLIPLASLFISLLPLSEARPLSPLHAKYGTIREVNRVFRTLKSSGPSPGIGHRLKKLQDLGGMKDSGPSPGVGHRVKRLQDLGGITDSGPSSGVGHKLKTVQDFGVIKNSVPSPGQGHKHITNNHS